MHNYVDTQRHKATELTNIQASFQERMTSKAPANLNETSAANTVCIAMLANHSEKKLPNIHMTFELFAKRLISTSNTPIIT